MAFGLASGASQIPWQRMSGFATPPSFAPDAAWGGQGLGVGAPQGVPGVPMPMPPSGGLAGLAAHYGQGPQQQPGALAAYAPQQFPAWLHMLMQQQAPQQQFPAWLQQQQLQQQAPQQGPWMGQMGQQWPMAPRFGGFGGGFGSMGNIGSVYGRGGY